MVVVKEQEDLMEDVRRKAGVDVSVPARRSDITRDEMIGSRVSTDYFLPSTMANDVESVYDIQKTADEIIKRDYQRVAYLKFFSMIFRPLKLL